MSRIGFWIFFFFVLGLILSIIGGQIYFSYKAYEIVSETDPDTAAERVGELYGKFLKGVDKGKE